QEFVLHDFRTSFRKSKNSENIIVSTLPVPVGVCITPMPPPPTFPGAAPPPVWPGSTGATPPAPSWPTQPAEQSWTPVPRPGTPGAAPNGNGAGLGAPIGNDVPPGTPLRTESIAQPAGTTPNRAGAPAAIPGPGASPPPWTPTAPPPTSPTTSVPAVPTRVPSCILTGQYLVNFALNDLAGESWEFRKHHGKLTLIDFWETRCVPCQHAIQHLNVLQTRYGPNGLQIVGIAYEKGTPQEQAAAVKRVQQRLKINYTLLLGGDTPQQPCPVLTQFTVRAYPTLVLVDDTGRILWRGEGLDRPQLAELETILRQRIGARR
ncbi:MAG: redoxin domain-containing protein, partial [Gemmataceae bacterium]|nr:redoxin domain-containing protein [Gemmataceae bacterium]